jgi:cell division protein ZipA
MDKELLRIVIIATGLLVIIGMILWSFIKKRRTLDDQDTLENEQVIGSSGAIDDSLKLHTERDEFDIVPLGSARHTLDNEDDSGWDTEFNDSFDDDDMESDTRIVIPDIIQFGIVANDEQGFNGVDLVLAFGMVDLEYGDLKVYERINKNGDVDYGVACMVEPGTFPEGIDLGSFYCPGILFYLQHRDLEDAQIVFDDFIDTIKTVAKELDGVVWDHQRQPLTEETIQAIRQSL